MPGEMNGPEELERASAPARVAFAFVAALLFAVMLASKPLFGAIEEWIGADPDRAFERVEMMIFGLALVSVPFLILGMVNLHFARRSIDTERFPPEGMPVIVDTPIVRGSKAVSRGRAMRVGGVLICIIAIGFPLALWLIVQRMAAGA